MEVAALRNLLHYDLDTGVLGMTKPKGKNRFCSSIRERGVQRRIGWFDTVEQAHQAYMSAKQQRDAALKVGV